MLLFPPAYIWAVPALLLYIMYYLVFVIHIYLAFVNNIGGYSPYLKTLWRFQRRGFSALLINVHFIFYHNRCLLHPIHLNSRLRLVTRILLPLCSNTMFISTWLVYENDTNLYKVPLFFNCILPSEPTIPSHNLSILPIC